MYHVFFRGRVITVIRCKSCVCESYPYHAIHGNFFSSTTTPTVHQSVAFLLTFYAHFLLWKKGQIGVDTIAPKLINLK